MSSLSIYLETKYEASALTSEVLAGVSKMYQSQIPTIRRFGDILCMRRFPEHTNHHVEEEGLF